MTSVAHVIVELPRPCNDTIDTSFAPDKFNIRKDDSGVIHEYESSKYKVVVHGVVYIPSGSDCTLSEQAKYIVDFLESNGLEQLAQLEGHYALFIWDKQEKKFYFWGDPNGGRPIFYAETPRSFYVSSKLKILTTVDSELCIQNQAYQDFFLVYGFFPFSETVYQPIKRTVAGSLGLLTENGFQFRELHKKDTVTQRFSDGRDKAKHTLNDILLSTCDEALKDYKNVSVLLGGFDSALIAALAKKLGKRVKAYTFKYENAIYDQANIDSVVSNLNIEHEWVRIGANLFNDGLRNYGTYFDKPTNWPNYVIQSTYLAQVSKEQNMEVVLTGDGCDEAFLGYPGIYRGARFFARETPRAIRRLIGALRKGLQISYLEQEFGHVYRLLLRVLSNLQLSKKERLYLMFRIMDENTIASLFGTSRSEAEKAIDAIRQTLIRDIPDTYSDTILAYEGRENIIPNKNKLTGMMDCSGLPIYSPFLHSEVRSYVRRFPEEFLRPNREAKRTSLGKYILLEMAEEYGYLPSEVIYQPKHAAVDGPLDAWYSADLRDLATELIGCVSEIKSERFLNRLLDEKAIDVMYRRRYSVDNITSHATSLLVTYGSYFLPQKTPGAIASQK